MGRYSTLRSELVDAINTQLATDLIAQVTVTPYPPYGNSFTSGDHIWLGAIRTEQEQATQGPGSRLEEGELDVIIQTPIRTGAGQNEWAQAEIRGELLIASLETLLANDFTIDGAAWDTEVASIINNVEVVDDKGAPLGRVTLTIRFQNYL